MNITIRNPKTRAESYYDSRALGKLARQICRAEHGKMHAFTVEIVEGQCVRLHASYTMKNGDASFSTIVL